MLERKDYVLNQIAAIGRLLAGMQAKDLEPENERVGVQFNECLHILDLDISMLNTLTPSEIVEKVKNDQLLTALSDILFTALQWRDEKCWVDLHQYLVEYLSTKKIGGATYYF